MNKKIAVTGSIGFDHIMKFHGKFSERILPEMTSSLSLSFLVDDLEVHIGGTATNIAYSLKLLNQQPLLVSALGKDGSRILDFFTSHGIATTHVLRADDMNTGAYFVISDSELNQIGSFYAGATQRANETQLPEATDFAIISPTLPEAMLLYVDYCQSHTIPYLFDPAFQIDHFSGDQLHDAISQAAILIANDYEMKLIEQKLHLSHEQLVSLVPILVTTLGEKGSLIEAGSQKINIPIAKPKEVIDPTGAGDAYRAGFITGYLNDYDLEICGMIGSVASVYAIETPGTVSHLYDLPSFESRFEANYHKKVTIQ